jgi:PhzF family phenazine biosynthesis protein
MSKYKYCVLDVFTSEKFKGNPLGVVFTDSDLELSVYENISREFGYSETSFIYYSAADKALKVRSFTPTGFEVGGAGHNLLGAVYAALLNGMEIFNEQQDERFVLMKNEQIHLSIENSGEKLLSIGMKQKPAIIGRSVDPEVIAKALSLKAGEVKIKDLVPTVVTTEVTHLMVPINSIDALNRAALNKTLFVDIANEYGFEGVYCFVISDKDERYIANTRFFSPGIGIEEDPATGSAAGPLAGFLSSKNYIKQGIVYQFLQGVKMNHPSVIKLKVLPDGIWISGSSVIVMEGVIYTG